MTPTPVMKRRLFIRGLPGAFVGGAAQERAGADLRCTGQPAIAFRSCNAKRNTEASYQVLGGTEII
jgi:hypothetical protein